VPLIDASADQTAEPELEPSEPGVPGAPEDPDEFDESEEPDGSDGFDEPGEPGLSAPDRVLTRADLRRPAWVAAHFGIVLLMVVFVLLGRWQWHAGHKVQPLTDSQMTAWRTPEPLDSVITPDAGLNGTQVGQAVEATGTYDAAHQLLVPGRMLNGRQGYYVIAPLITGTGQDVVVNRGWLPGGDGSAAPAIPAPPAGKVTVLGWAAEPESTTGDVNDNGIVQAAPGVAAAGPDQVSFIAPAQLVNMWPYPLLDGYLSATDSRSASGGLTAIPAPLPAHGTSWDLLNVGYAFQWCLFAVIAGGWYVLYWRRELAGPRPIDPDSDPDPDQDSGSDPDSERSYGPDPDPARDQEPTVVDSADLPA
jgi:cytochrome oxidase assembly protein ShyY1